MPALNPEIMVWARETAGLDLVEAARKTGLDESRLAKIERGETSPSHPTVLAMAKVYRRPPITFYLERIPTRAAYGADFRGYSGKSTPKEQALVEALLRFSMASQQLIRSTMELEDEGDPLPYVGLLQRQWDLPTGAKSMDRMLRQLPKRRYEELVLDALGGLDMVVGDQCSREDYYACPNATAAFALLRAACEDAGIFVTLKDNLGSHHSRVATSSFRAFVIADEIAPYMVINSQDSPPARAFSILHELVHLLLDQSGISDSNFEQPVEAFCNRVAGEWLLPSDFIQSELANRQSGNLKPNDFIATLARTRNLSHTMVAVRLRQNGLISADMLDKLSLQYQQEWERSRQSEPTKQKGKKVSGPTFYNVQRSRLGDGMLRFTRRMVQSGGLTVTKAAIVLSVKPWQVTRLLKPTQD